MKKILVITNYFIPGFKAGGPIRSVSNLIDHLNDSFKFNLVTKDRDSGDTKPFKDIEVDKWTTVGKAKVFYHSPNKLTLFYLAKLIKNTSHNVIYLNSFFSRRYSVYPIILKKLGVINKPIILAPRGEFNEGALSLKKIKKKLYIYLSKMLGLHNNIIWHATNEIEENKIKQIYGRRAKVKIASNLPAKPDRLPYGQSIKKETGSLKILYLSRITKMKNLKFILNILEEIEEKIEFNIYGLISDEKYWSECKSIIKKLPKNIKINYYGPIPHHKVKRIFLSHHFFLLPTLGENYGHVIYESMSNGCIPIISDRTPWNDLNKNSAGWNIPLEAPERYLETIKKCYYMEDIEYQNYTSNAIKYAHNYLMNKNLIQNSKDLFLG